MDTVQACPKCGRPGCRHRPPPAESIELRSVMEELELLRERRDMLIREHPGTLREIAALTGLSYQRIQQIKTERNQR